MKARFISIILLATLLYNCSPSTGSGTATDSTAAATVANTGPALVTFSLWKELGVRDAASDKGKYLSTIYLGEQVILTSDSAMEGEHLWNKITMSDGKSGWVRADFIAKKKLPAAIKEETSIYKRPDLATVTDISFGVMQFLSANPPVNGWVHVKGKRNGDKWFTEGYMEASRVTFEKIDAEFAALYSRMAETETQSVHDAIMTQLQDSPDFRQSIFYNVAFAEEPEGDLEGDYEEGQDSDAAYPAGPPYAIESVPDLEGDGEGMIINIYGQPDYYYVYRGRAYKLEETAAENILQTVLFYHCTQDYLNSLPLDDKVLDVIPAHGYVPQ